MHGHLTMSTALFQGEKEFLRSYTHRCGFKYQHYSFECLPSISAVLKGKKQESLLSKTAASLNVARNLRLSVLTDPITFLLVDVCQLKPDSTQPSYDTLQQRPLTPGCVPHAGAVAAIDGAHCETAIM